MRRSSPTSRSPSAVAPRRGRTAPRWPSSVRRTRASSSSPPPATTARPPRRSAMSSPGWPRPPRPGANPQPTGDLINLPITQSPGFANGNNDGCSAFASAHTFDRDVTASERIFGDGFEGSTLPAIYQKGIAVLHLDANNSGGGSVRRRGNALNAGAAGVLFVYNAYI